MTLNLSDWAVAHDYLYALGGAERVTAAIANDTLGGSARVYALGGDARVTGQLGLADIRYLGPRQLNASNYRAFGLAMPLMASSLPVLPCNAIVSSYAFAHHVRAEGFQVVYCHSPLRQIWSGAAAYSQDRFSHRAAINVGGPLLRRLDRRAARRADMYIATSRLVRDRIMRYYGIEAAAVVPPPVHDAFFVRGRERGDHLVWAGRIVEPYKKLSLLIEAVRGTNQQLVVAGDGRDADRLRATAPPNVHFVGALPADRLASLFAGSRGVVFPSLDDFGMIPIEAMASGTPVLAFGGGGALETVLPEENGLFFGEHTVESLRAGLDAFATRSWDHERIRAHAARYSQRTFSTRLQDLLSALS